MHWIWPWLVLLLASIGNCGWWLFCFNRVNAFGYPRALAKLLEKTCIGLCFAIPAMVAWRNWPIIQDWLQHPSPWPGQTSLELNCWLSWNLWSLAILGPMWLNSRRWLIRPAQLIDQQGVQFHVHRQIPGGSAGNWSTRLWARLPMNDWAHLEVTRKTLKLERQPPTAAGLKIGHLSDLHFTGQYRAEHYQFVIERTMELEADLLVISGDIIDFQHCLPLVEGVLGQLAAPLGVHFVLGNHDRRLKDLRRLIETLSGLGFHDLGVADRVIDQPDRKILLTGDEAPWLKRRGGNHPSATAAVPEIDSTQFHGLRIGVAHTPDRIHWARRKQLDLLLAGHTHGGQARLPLIGPLVAPSLHGSQFASGVFHLPPTLMHVSRGVAGTHTVRWRCPTEVSLLTLAHQAASKSSHHRQTVDASLRSIPGSWRA
ncbi:MAG: metallophosphoesterase [Pirellulaceae bacterium]|nr:metallophosphoesterase [Pirellulaceae bacterium]